MISFLGETKKNNKLDLIKPGDNLKFELIDDVYKNGLSFELGKVHTKKSLTLSAIKFLILLYCEQKKTKERVKKER